MPCRSLSCCVPSLNISLWSSSFWFEEAKDGQTFSLSSWLLNLDFKCRCSKRGMSKKFGIGNKVFPVFITSFMSFFFHDCQSCEWESTDCALLQCQPRQSKLLFGVNQFLLDFTQAWEASIHLAQEIQNWVFMSKFVATITYILLSYTCHMPCHWDHKTIERHTETHVVWHDYLTIKMICSRIDPEQ
jgi:hypothetical protein